MKTKNNLIFGFLWAALLTLGLSSCVVDDYLLPDNGAVDGKEITVPISMSVLPIESMNTETRAKTYEVASEDEKTIHDLWVIEYNENGMRTGLPHYFEEDEDGNLPTKLNIIRPRRAEDKYTCVLIANSNDSLLFSKDNTARYINLDSLRNFDLPTHNHEHVFNPTGGKYLLMSGWTTISQDTKELSVDLIRNVCKVKVTLTGFNDEKLVYKYFQWRDVPLGKAFPHGYTKYHQYVSRDWKQHLDDDPGEDQKRVDLEKGLIFYIPCSVWLPNGPKMPGNNLKETERYEDATHFVVVARERIVDKTESNETEVSEQSESGDGNEDNQNEGNQNEVNEMEEGGEQYEFCLYPSKDVDTQFDFQPNHYYEMEINIGGLPEDYEDDPFVKELEYKYLQESNCYMMRRDSKDLFAVPITRINRYWESFNNDKAELLDENTEWVAEVIWQDTPERIFEFTSFRRFQVAKDKSHLEAKGTIYTKKNGSTVENTVPLGDGDELPMCFAFRTTGTGEGNVIVGVRKKVPGWETIPVEKREYLWSWHIWITDYDANFIIPANPAAGEKDSGGGNGDVNYQWMHHEVPGGEVQKYSTSGEMKGSSLYMMDRNLGATNTFTNREYVDDIFYHVLAGDWKYKHEEVRRTLGMYYQYGRKDPFPYYDSDYQAVYNIKGEIIEAFNHFPNMIISEQDEAWNSGQPTNVSIKYPYKFYTADRAHPFWYDWYLASDETDNHEWNDPGIGTFSGKKFFDPCPPGWKLPEDMYDTFTSIGQEDDTQWFDYDYDKEKTFENTSYGFFAAFMKYTEDEDYDYYKEPFIYFPSTGKRDPENGGGDGGNIWTFNAFNGTWTETKVMLVHNVPQANFESSLPACTGVPVRCMREYPN